MIATALALQNATQEAVIDITTMMKARRIFQGRNEMSEQDFTDALFEYSAHLASLTTTLVTNTLLTEAEMDELNSTVREMEAMGKDID